MWRSILEIEEVFVRSNAAVDITGRWYIVFVLSNAWMQVFGADMRGGKNSTLYTILVKLYSM